jgi:hypothetical protein
MLSTTIKHANKIQVHFAGVVYTMKHSVLYKDHVTGTNGKLFVVQFHFTETAQEKIYFFLPNMTMAGRAFFSM